MTHSKTVKNLRMRYIIGLSAIALLVTASFITMKRVVSQQRDHARLVNIAGHQSGLSNRIAYFVSLMANAGDEEEFETARAQVNRAINQMQSNHTALRNGDPEERIPYITSETLTTIYDDPMVGLDLAMDRFLERARNCYESDYIVFGTESIDYIYTTNYGPHVLQPLLDAAVDEYETIGREAILEIEKFELVIWIATLVTLLLEAGLIFRPLENNVRRTIEDLQSSIRQLTKTRQRLVEAQRLALVGDWELDVQSRRLTWSDQIYKIAGVSPDAFVLSQDSALERIHPGDRRKVTRHLTALMAREKVADIEFRIIRPDGDERLVAQHAAFRPAKNGRDAVISGAIQDITERKELSRRLETLSENIPGFILQFNVDHDGVIRTSFASKGVFEIFGIDPNRPSTEASVLFDRIADEDRDRVLKNIEVQGRGLKTWSDQFRIVYPGDAIWIEGHATPERLSDGTTRWYGYFWDITERKDAEDERSKLKAQLHQALKMEALGTLAGGIAHDFNNILSAIIGYAELGQLSASEKDTVVRHLDQVLKAGDRAKGLVQQILTYSRQTEQELKPVSMKYIAKEALKLIRASLPSTISIKTYNLSDTLVMGDPTQLHQIIMNLCTNASHAMNESGGTLEVRLVDMEITRPMGLPEPQLNKGPHLKLTVADSGHGMTPDVMGRIFDPFFTTKATGEGTGMGLAVVHGLIESYGGAIHVKSEPDRGSRFDVYLPAIASVTEQALLVEGAPPHGSEHILLVDDEPDLIDIGRQMLVSLDYTVTTRSSSLEALKLFETHPDRFDAVITDMTMPQMTGDLLAEKLSAIRSDIPILLCTGYSALINEKSFEKIGINGLLMKPIVRADLAKKIRSVLDEAKG